MAKKVGLKLLEQVAANVAGDVGSVHQVVKVLGAIGVISYTAPGELKAEVERRRAEALQLEIEAGALVIAAAKHAESLRKQADQVVESASDEAKRRQEIARNDMDRVTVLEGYGLS